MKQQDQNHEATGSNQRNYNKSTKQQDQSMKQQDQINEKTGTNP